MCILITDETKKDYSFYTIDLMVIILKHLKIVKPIYEKNQ